MLESTTLSEGSLRWPRTRVGDVVYVEARIHKLGSFLQILHHAAMFSSPSVILPDKLLEELGSRWETQVLVDVACEFALACSPIDFRHEAFIETKHEIPVSGIGRQGNIHLQVSVADDSVVQVHANEIVVSRVSRADELFERESARPAIAYQFWWSYRLGNVWDIHARITFASEVHPPVLHAEQLDKILPEADELGSQLIFGLDVWFTL